MKNGIGILLTLAGVGAAVANWLDAVCFTDPASEFVIVGSIWLRYGGVAVLAVLAVLGGAMAVNQPQPPGRRLGFAMGLAEVLAAILCAALGALQLAGAQLLPGMLALLCAWNLVCRAGWSAAPQQSGPAGGLLVSMAGTGWMFYLTFVRFSGHYASIHHFVQTLRVFSALAALLFLASALRVSFFPDTGGGRAAARYGLLAFYLCSCGELPRALAGWLAGSSSLSVLLTGGVVGAVGFAGLFCALWLLAAETLPKQVSQRINWQ